MMIPRLLRSTSSNRIYFALVALRLLVALTSLSTIHPDEYFQNPEVGAALVFDYADDGLLRTWEWEGESPCRSIGVVGMTTGIAFWILKSLAGNDPSARMLFLAQRSFFWLHSLMIDYAISHLSPYSDMPLLIFATSPLAFTFLLRPFSNAIESSIFAAAFLLLQRMSSTDRARGRTVLLPAIAIVLAFGVWTRITFLAFMLPIILAAVSLVVDLPLFFSRRLIDLLLRSALPSLLAFLCTSFALSLIDTSYFRRHGTALSSLVIAPLNSLRFNMSTQNLAAHGLHPRYLHVFVNWPLLFGAGLFGVAEAAAAVVKRWRGEEVEEGRKERESFLQRVYLAAFIIPTMILSIQPHQEARFLLPLIIPLCLLAGHSSLFRVAGTKTSKGRKVFWSIWLLHSLFFAVFFGYLHQGGLLPALFKLNDQLRQPDSALRSRGSAVEVELVFWKTFMPPRHLLLAPLSSATEPSLHVHITDLSSRSSKIDVHLALARLLLHGSRNASFMEAGKDGMEDEAATAGMRRSNEEQKEERIVLLITPAWAFDQLQLDAHPPSSPSSSSKTLLLSSSSSLTASPLFYRRTFADEEGGLEMKARADEEETFGYHLDTDELGSVLSMRWSRSGVGIYVVGREVGLKGSA